MDRIRRPLLALVCCALLPPGFAHAAKVQVELEGMDKALRTAVRSELEIARYTQREVTAAQVRRLFERGEAQIRRTLEPYGYYNPQVATELTETPAGYVATFKITPGEPTQVKSLSIAIDEDAAAQRPVRRARRQFHPREGEVLDHAQYELGKATLQTAILGSGYLDAELTRSRVEVTRASNSATIDLAWRTGPRYRYGNTTFTGSHLRAGFLERYVPWQAGDYYSQQDLLRLQQRLVDADYFAIAEVAPDVENAVDGIVPITVTLAPAKRTVYTGGVFIGTDSGPGVRGGIDRRWVNDRGHKLKVDLELSQRLNLLSTLYQIPRPGPNNRSWNVGLAYRDEDTDTSQSQTIRLTANETREWKGFTRTLGMQAVTGDFTVAEEDGNTTLIYPEATLSRKSGDNVDFPRQGWSFSTALRGTHESLLSDTSFVQARADAKWLRGIGRNARFIARGTLGATWVDDFNRLPPELRFFGGGDRSIRGYAYQTIGPRNERDKVIGGENLFVASAEYEYYFVRNWGAAVFVDAGDAFTGTDFDTKVGTGLGLRWRSPVGLVRVDLGVPVGDEFESGLQLHLVIGPDL